MLLYNYKVSILILYTINSWHVYILNSLLQIDLLIYIYNLEALRFKI